MDNTKQPNNRDYDLSLINKNHVLSALNEIDQKGIPPNAHSSTYDLIYNGEPYPPKLVLSWAYKHATGKELERNLFEGGLNTPCFNTLEKLGFTIVLKNSNIELLYQKEVDYTALTECFTVVYDVLPRFIEILGDIEPGKRRKIKVTIEEKDYEVDFRQINTTQGANVYQIVYPVKGDVSSHLISLFPEAYKILEEERSKANGKKSYAKLPADKKEYLLIYYDKKNKKLVWQKKENMESFYPHLQQFIKQADKGGDQTTKQYANEYKGLEVVTSFGKGNAATIPWISFLYEGQTTQNGIYPCFLYYKQQKLLILAYTMSETFQAAYTWELPEETETITNYFKTNNLGKPKRYGASYIFKVYHTSSPLNPQQIDNDLQEIIDIYKNLMAKNTASDNNDADITTPQPFTLSRTSDIRRTGLLFNPDLVNRYAISLLTKPFVILSGLSGSGKTKLALSFAKWLTGKSEQVKIISVGADWNNREYLLGYPNALHEKQYVKPDNGVLDFIIRASNDPDMPYFLILDEMNLSYVERYFADFLSTMESRQPITLHPGPGVWDDKIPPTLTLPENLYITGTINVDETTYMFSPKVLDRANVIEFRINAEEMTTFLAECKPLDADAADHLGASMQKDFVERSKSNNLESDPDTNNILLDFFTALKKAGAEFGYRTASEIYRYITIAKELEASDGSDEEEVKRKNHRIDVVIMQKLLPKLHGSRKKIQPILQTLWNLCQKKGDKTTIEKEDIRFDEQFIYPLSAAKIWQMNKNAKDNGFTSYAEA
ncbi:MAG: DUF3578 domain-containing protein [Candidatus Azobacteroides sp.]|nr:DUF3578 domain-containing protein [Candidatus Azobacteroides sp.]